MKELAINLQQLLDGFVDMAYLTDADGHILLYNRTRWNEFALHNGAPELTDPARLIGRPVYEFIEGEETRMTYRRFTEALLEGRREDVTFRFYCDAPDRRRLMRLSISPIHGEEKTIALLYHTILLSETIRPAMGIFKVAEDRPEAPLLGICSYCKDVRYPPGSKTGEWMSAERYYQTGGTDHVRLSHGVCPTCYNEIVGQFA